MTQEQRFDSIGKVDTFELRRYHPCVIAEVSVKSDFESAGSSGFRPLFGYIAGANHSRAKVAMTSPVIQEPGQEITVSGSALESDDGQIHKIGFVMPAEYSNATELPAPNDSRVTLKAIPEHLAIVDRFSGRWSVSIYAKRLQQLNQAALQAGYEPAGQARFARFDPPYTPWFMRRNEIQLPVRKVD